MLVWLLGKLWVNYMNIPLRRASEGGECWCGSSVSFWVNRMNIPLRPAAPAFAGRCPPSKGELVARWQYGIFYRPERIR